MKPSGLSVNASLGLFPEPSSFRHPFRIVTKKLIQSRRIEQKCKQ